MDERPQGYDYEDGSKDQPETLFGADLDVILVFQAFVHVKITISNYPLSNGSSLKTPVNSGFKAGDRKSPRYDLLQPVNRFRR